MVFLSLSLVWEKERYVYTIYIIYYKRDSYGRERKIERETGVGEKGRKRDMGDRKLEKRDKVGREKDRKRDMVGEIGVGERKRDRQRDRQRDGWERERQ